ncbi:hypothetical protein DL98DRAFT_542633 [Cadophora sp. DSE1049]|nr:hypothetical protein DL98DRAFT_542633 [Cadophora sp. DSE1049]
MIRLAQACLGLLRRAAQGAQGAQMSCSGCSGSSGESTEPRPIHRYKAHNRSCLVRPKVAGGRPGCWLKCWSESGEAEVGYGSEEWIDPLMFGKMIEQLERI